MGEIHIFGLRFGQIIAVVLQEGFRKRQRGPAASQPYMGEQRVRANTIRLRPGAIIPHIAWKKQQPLLRLHRICAGRYAVFPAVIVMMP